MDTHSNHLTIYSYDVEEKKATYDTFQFENTKSYEELRNLVPAYKNPRYVLLTYEFEPFEDGFEYWLYSCTADDDLHHLSDEHYLAAFSGCAESNFSVSAPNNPSIIRWDIATHLVYKHAPQLFNAKKANLENLLAYYPELEGQSLKQIQNKLVKQYL